MYKTRKESKNAKRTKKTDYVGGGALLASPQGFWRKLFRAVGSIVKFFPLSGDGLRERSFCHSELVSEFHYYLEDKKLRRYEGKLLSENSQSSNPPALLSSNNQSGGNALLIPPYELTCNHGTNIPSLEGRGSKGVGENKPSPQPSPMGEGECCHPELVSGSCDMLNDRVQSDVHEMLKQVQHDLNNLVRQTYSQNRMKPLPLALSRNWQDKCASRTLLPSLKKRAAFTLTGGATHVAHFDNVRKAAFTLAEVLITLGIIGIVAALVMPGLIANHRKQAYLAQLKKAANTVTNGLQLILQDTGYEDVADIDITKMVENGQIKKYFSVIETNKDSDFHYRTYHSFSQPARRDTLGMRGPSIVTVDGAELLFASSDVVAIDLNGYSKIPNKAGVDFFIMNLNSRGMPVTWYDDYHHGIIYPHNSHDAIYGSGGCIGNGHISTVANSCFDAILIDNWEIKYY